MKNIQNTAIELAKYKVYGLPGNYINKSWADTAMPASEIKRLTEIFANDLPSGSVLFVHGSAAPIINQLMNKGLNVRGIDITDRLSQPFESYNNPNCDVVLITGVENPVGNPKITKKTLDDVIIHYKAYGALIVISSSDTSAVVEGNYGIKFVNKLIIKYPAEKSFL